MIRRTLHSEKLPRRTLSGRVRTCFFLSFLFFFLFFFFVGFSTAGKGLERLPKHAGKQLPASHPALPPPRNAKRASNAANIRRSTIPPRTGDNQPPAVPGTHIKANCYSSHCQTGRGRWAGHSECVKYCVKLIPVSRMFTLCVCVCVF